MLVGSFARRSLGEGGESDPRHYDTNHPIQDRIYSTIYPGTMMDPDGKQVDIVVKKAKPNGYVMFERESTIYKAVFNKGHFGDSLRPHLSPALIDDDKHEITLLNLHTLGFSEHLDILSEIELPSQRVLFVDLMEALCRLHSVSGSLWSMPNDFAGREAKGIWVKPADNRFEIAFTDFGLFDFYPDVSGNTMPTNYKKLWLDHPEEKSGVVNLFPFVERHGDKIIISDQILDAYHDSRTGLGIADILTGVLRCFDSRSVQSFIYSY